MCDTVTVPAIHVAYRSSDIRVGLRSYLLSSFQYGYRKRCDSGNASKVHG